MDIINKVLFLDFDGVLNRIGETRMDRRPVFEPDLILKLNLIVELTNCDIVITSTWRTHYSVRSLGRLLGNWGFLYPHKIIGKTPDLSTQESASKLWKATSRGAEICSWLVTNNYTGNYVVVDDTADMDGVWAHFVEINGAFGMTDEDVVDIVERLNGS